jgi:predicted  nucleic acid-binding Zn-ribbon protein
MAFRQIKSPALADKAVLNTKLDESAVQGQSTLTGMVNPADCFTLLYDVGSDSLKKIGADAFFASFSTDDLQEGANQYFTPERAKTAVASDIASAVAVETNRATVAETLLQTNIDAEASTRSSADVVLQSNIDAEVTRATARENAIEIAYQSADTALSGRIDLLLNNTDSDAIDSFAEIIAAFEDADDALSASIIANSSAITAEVTRATNKETEINDRVSVEITRAQSAESALAVQIGQETTRATGAEAALSARISTEEGLSTSLQSQITAEVTRATNAENANTAAISSEVTRATGAEAANAQNITDEILARAVADTQVRADLGADIVTAEAAAKAHAEAQDALMIGDVSVDGTVSNTVTDRIATAKAEAITEATNSTAIENAARIAEDSDINARIDQELIDRAAGDTTLQGNIDTEEAARIAGDANLQSQVDFITNNTDPAALDSLTEIVSAFQSSDSDMSALISSNTTAIATEKLRAETAEGVLQTNINTEASTRSTADTGLQSQIDQINIDIQVEKDDVLAEAKAYTDSEADSHQAVAIAHADAQDAALIGDASVDGTAGNTVTSRIATAKSQSYAYTDAEVATEKARAEAAEEAVALRTTVLEGEMDSVQVLSSQNETDLRAEEVARASGDTNLQGQIDALDSNTTIEVDDLQAQITAEIARASGVESTNAAAVVTEKQRAEAVEQGLRADVNTNIANISSNLGDINVERTRALAAEGALSTRLDLVEDDFNAVDSDLQAQILAETARAGGVEAGLQTSVDSLQTQVTGNDSDILALQNLQGTDVADLQSQLDAEIVRASAAEVVNANAVVAETTRATGVEAGLRTDVDSNQSQITANDSDILALQVLQAADHSDNQAQITAEVNRATAAEGVNAAAVVTEKNRAEGIEAGLRTDVDSVQVQVTANDSDILALQNLQGTDVADLQSQLDAEVVRATAAEGVLTTDLTTLETRVDFIVSNEDGAALDSLTEIVAAFQGADSDLDGLISANSGRLTTAENDIDAVEVRATDLEARATAVEGRATSLEAGQVVQNGRLSVNEADIDSLQAKQGTGGFHTTAQTVVGAVNEIHGELDVEAGNVDLLQSEMDVAQGRLDGHDSDFTAIQGRATSLEGRATTLEGRATALETKQGSAALQTVATDLSAAINELHAEIDGEAADLTSLEARVTTEEANVDTLQSEMDAVEGRATSLESRMTTEEGHVDTLQTQMGTSTLLTVATDVTAAVNELHGQADSNTGRVGTLEVEMDAVEGRATSLETRASALETEQTLQGGRLTVNEADIDALEAKVGSSTETLDTVSQTLVGAINEVHGETDTNTSGLAAAVARADADSDALVSEIADRIAADSQIRIDLAADRVTDQTDYIARDAVVLASAQTYAENEADDAEVAAKTYADGIVANEATLRENADDVLDGKITTEATARANADNALDSRTTVLETEMSATQLGAGLATDGTYVAPTTTNYIDASTSLADADKKLDAAIKAVDNTRNSGINNLQSQIDAEIARATAAEGVLTSDLATEVTRATDAETALGVLITTNATAISDESSRAQGVEGSLQTQIDFITSNTDSAALDSLTEIVAAFQSADGSLAGLVAQNQTDIATNASGLAQEITDRVAGDNAVRGEFATADAALQTQIDGRVQKSGDSMTGDLAMGGNKVSGVATGTDAADAVNKGQMDAGLAAQHISQFSTDDLVEGTKKFFSDALSRASVSLTDVAGEGKASYDQSTGVFSIDTAKTMLELADVADSDYDGKNGYVLRVNNTLDGMSLQDPTQLAFNNAQRQTMSGDGAQSTFALNFYTQDQNAIVFVGGVIQDPSVHYSIDAANQTITFNAALPVGTQAVVIAQSTNSVGVLDPKSVGLETLADNIKVFEQGNDVVAGTSATVVSAFNKTTYRSAKYVVTTELNGEFETRECLVIHNGTDAFITEYGILYTGSSLLGDTDVQVNGSSVELTYTAVDAGAVVSVSATYVDA